MQHADSERQLAGQSLQYVQGASRRCRQHAPWLTHIFGGIFIISALALRCACSRCRRRSKRVSRARSAAASTRQLSRPARLRRSDRPRSRKRHRGDVRGRCDDRFDLRYLATRSTIAAVEQKTQPVLEVRDLATTFKTEDGLVRAVNGLSFSVDAGTTMGIVGESGLGQVRHVALDHAAHPAAARQDRTRRGALQG